MALIRLWNASLSAYFDVTKNGQPIISQVYNAVTLVYTKSNFLGVKIAPLA